jgi:hypothetical protein
MKPFSSKKTEMPQWQIDKSNDRLRTYIRKNVLLDGHHLRHLWSVRAAANEVGVSPRMITYVLSGKKTSRPLLLKLAALPKRPKRWIFIKPDPAQPLLVRTTNPAWSGEQEAINVQ